MEHDAETKQIITAAEHVVSLIESQGWAIVKEKLDTKILDLQNISNIDMSKPETLSVQVAARVLAAQLLFEWLKNDVYGFVQQQKANNAPGQKEPDNDIIDLGVQAPVM